MFGGFTLNLDTPVRPSAGSANFGRPGLGCGYWVAGFRVRARGRIPQSYPDTAVTAGLQV